MYNSADIRHKKIDICDRTFRFGVGIIRLINEFPKGTVGFKIGEQLIRSGTSIGANIEEAQNSSTKKEFIYSLTIALKEARETDYWMRISRESGIISESKVNILLRENLEIIKILTTIIKNSKRNIS